jgi:hypothetical protein
MTRRIVQLIEERINRLNLFDTRIPDVKAARALEESQNIEVFVSVIEEVLLLRLRRESQQCEVTMSKENKNQNGNRITETKITGKKARNLSKKRAKIKRLQNIPEGASTEEKLVEFELHRDIRPAT